MQQPNAIEEREVGSCFLQLFRAHTGEFLGISYTFGAPLSLPASTTTHSKHKTIVEKGACPTRVGPTYAVGPIYTGGPQLIVEKQRVLSFVNPGSNLYRGDSPCSAPPLVLLEPSFNLRELEPKEIA